MMLCLQCYLLFNFFLTLIRLVDEYVILYFILIKVDWYNSKEHTWGITTPFYTDRKVIQRDSVFRKDSLFSHLFSYLFT